MGKLYGVNRVFCAIKIDARPESELFTHPAVGGEAQHAPSDRQRAVLKAVVHAHVAIEQYHPSVATPQRHSPHLHIFQI